MIIGKNHRSAIATLVERKSRQTLIVGLGDSYDAANTAKAITQALARQPSHMMCILTWDQGREITRWADIEKTVGIKVYFCEPRSPWQQPLPTNKPTVFYDARYPNTPTSTSTQSNSPSPKTQINNMPRKLHH